MVLISPYWRVIHVGLNSERCWCNQWLWFHCFAGLSSSSVAYRCYWFGAKVCELKESRVVQGFFGWRIRRLRFSLSQKSFFSEQRLYRAVTLKLFHRTRHIKQRFSTFFITLQGFHRSSACIARKWSAVQTPRGSDSAWPTSKNEVHDRGHVIASLTSQKPSCQSALCSKILHRLTPLTFKQNQRLASLTIVCRHPTQYCSHAWWRSSFDAVEQQKHVAQD